MSFDDFDDARRNNRQALMRSMPDFRQNQIINPEHSLMNTQDTDNLLEQLGDSLRFSTVEIVRPDGQGGYVRTAAEITNTDSACGCVLSPRNPPRYICQMCRKEICGSPSCSKVCRICDKRICIRCAMPYQGHIFCYNCYPNFFERLLFY